MRGGLAKAPGEARRQLRIGSRASGNNHEANALSKHKLEPVAYRPGTPELQSQSRHRCLAAFYSI